MEYSINKLASIAGVTTRTLRYYDQIGILKPERIGENGYRIYTKKELLKLQQILFFRELDFELDQIAEILNNPDLKIQSILSDQKELLNIKKRRLEALIKTIEKTIKSQEGEIVMKDEEYFGSLSETEMEEYKEEAQQRWGHTDAYKQSAERVKNMSKEELKRIGKEGNDNYVEMSAIMHLGIESAEVQAIVQKCRDHISIFYDCSLEMFEGLADMYIQDERFTKNLAKFHPDFPVFLNKAIKYYCRASKS